MLADVLIQLEVVRHAPDQPLLLHLPVHTLAHMCVQRTPNPEHAASTNPERALILNERATSRDA
jgi:hypothetical protein